MRGDDTNAAFFTFSVSAGVEAAGPPADGGSVLPGEKW